MTENCWIANVSDGSTHTEKWINGEISPWGRLMDYCKKNNVYVTNLRMTVGTDTVSCQQNAIGYWQSKAMPSVQGLISDEELHQWHGIGWVEGDTVHIIWGARDPQTHQVVFWNDARSPEGQNQIIWGKKEFALEPVSVTDTPVKNMKEYTAAIERAAE